MRPTSVLYLVNDLGDFSVNRQILELVKRLEREIYEFHVGSLGGVNDVMEAHFRQAGARVVSFSVAGNRDFDVIRRVARYVNTKHIEVVHTHVMRPDLLGGLGARVARHPLLVSTKHNMGYVRGQRGWVVRNLLYWPLMYLPDQVITVTEALRRQVMSRLRIKADRVSTIHTGVDIQDCYRPSARYPCRRSLGVGNEDLVVSYTGRLVGGKGLDCFLLAARQILDCRSDCCFLVVGDGALREELQCLAGDLGIAGRVIFTGFRRDIADILAATDVFVLPSLSEGLPMSLMEAMAAGKASVVTRVGGIVELVEDMVTGIYVPQRDATALADAVSRLLGDRSRRQEMGRRAQESISLNFSQSKMVEAYDALYQSMLSKSRAEGRGAPRHDVAF